MKKKRTKKFNPTKSLQLMSKQVLKDVVVLYLTSESQALLVSKKTGQLVKWKSELDCLTEVRRQWMIYLLVFRKRQDGQEYITVGESPITTECLSSQLDNSINQAAYEFAQEGNTTHNVNMGWLAVPSSQELTQAQIEAICKPWTPWDYLAQWEAKEKGYVPEE